jgi:hypothetical protein
MAVKIISNYHRRELLYWEQLTEAEREEHDWYDPDTDSYEFFHYKDWTYCIADFTTSHPDLKALGWDGQHNDTYFSGILIKYPVEDYGDIDTEHIIVGWFYSVYDPKED